ncbi:HD domain-containing protein [Candidatus Woesearchaeota archaeon]|nr:HD domain-containing protein [Candidatus Woesearchaeota archaeon]
MKEIYEKMWKLAKPYYEKGRPMDIAHVEWMMKYALFVCEKEKIDDEILLPLVILHDMGYAGLPKDNPFNLDMRKTHMKAGAEIAEKILKQVSYPRDDSEKIIHYVSMHDNWALGDNEIYKKDKILGVFDDLEFIWLATPQGFPALMKILGFTEPEQMIEYIEQDDKPEKRPFATKTTKELFEKYLSDRKKELKK